MTLEIPSSTRVILHQTNLELSKNPDIEKDPLLMATHPSSGSSSDLSFMLAVKAGKTDTAEALWRAGANPISAFDEAVFRGDLKLLSALLDGQGTHFDEAFLKSEFASKQSRQKASKDLAGIQKFAKDFRPANLLEKAIIERNVALCKTLVPLKNPPEKRADKVELIHLAALYAPWEVLELLIQTGEDPTVKDAEGKGVLHYASANPDGRVFLELLKKVVPESEQVVPLFMFLEAVRQRDPLNLSTADKVLFAGSVLQLLMSGGWLSKDLAAVALLAEMIGGARGVSVRNLLSSPLLLLGFLRYFGLLPDVVGSSESKPIFYTIGLLGGIIGAASVYRVARRALAGVRASWEHKNRNPLKAFLSGAVLCTNAFVSSQRFYTYLSQRPPEPPKPTAEDVLRDHLSQKFNACNLEFGFWAQECQPLAYRAEKLRECFKNSFNLELLQNMTVLERFQQPLDFTCINHAAAVIDPNFSIEKIVTPEGYRELDRLRKQAGFVVAADKEGTTDTGRAFNEVSETLRAWANKKNK